MDKYSLKEGFLKEGSVVIFPTDTIYGLGCRLYDEVAIKRILEIKKRPENKPLAVLCDTLVTVNDLAIIDERVLKLAHAFWPGAMTLVLKSSLSHFEKTGHKTVGVRIPDHSGVIRLIKQNGPLIATSVNLSGENPLTDYEKIVERFTDEVDYIYKETNAFYLNVSSTTIDLTNEEVKVVREGTITKENIKEILETT